MKLWFTRRDGLEKGMRLAGRILWSGAVADPTIDDEVTTAIRTFNERRRNDARVSISLVPIGDGLTLMRKRE